MALFNKKKKNKAEIPIEEEPVVYDDIEAEDFTDDISDEMLANLDSMNRMMDEMVEANIVEDLTLSDDYDITRPVDYDDTDETLAMKSESLVQTNLDSYEDESDDGVDAELWALIQKDREVSESVREIQDIDNSFVEEAEIYDTIVPEAAESAPSVDVKQGEKEKKTGFLSNLFSSSGGSSALKYYIIIGALAVLLLAGGVSLLIISSHISKQKRNQEEQLGRVITQPPPNTTANDASYIFVHEVQSYEGDMLVVEKILIDERETTIYFNKQISDKDYMISLTDDKGFSYPFDLFYIMGDTQISRNKTAVHFMPLNNNVSVVRIDVENRDTGDICSFRLRFESPTRIYAISRLKSPINISAQREDTGNSDVWIDDIQFAYGQTIVSFSIKPREGAVRELAFDPETPITITMRDNGARLLPLTEEPIVYDFGEGYVSGSIRFNPVKNVGGNVSVTFSNLIERYILNETIDASSLFVKGDDRAKTLVAGPYSIVLEGMQLQGDHYVLVAHAERDGVRERVYLEAEFAFTGSDGMRQLTIGTCRSSDKGSDVLFPVTYDAAAVRDFDPELTITDVSFNVKELSTNINVADSFAQKERSETHRAVSAIENAFTKRLDYRMGLSFASSLTGTFSDDILSDFTIMKPYRPIRAYNPYALNNAQVAFLSESGGSDEGDETTVYAIVYEYSDSRVGEPVFMNIHKVEAVKSRLTYVITSDEIIN